MLPIMLGEKANIGIILKIIGFKVIIGIIVGLLVDLIYFKIQKTFICSRLRCNLTGSKH